MITGTNLGDTTPPAGKGNVHHDVLPRDFRTAFLLVTALFFLWGVPANLNDVLIRQFMKSFQITRFEAGLVQSAFFLGYFVMAIPAGLVMRKRGYKFGLITGLLIYGTGTLLFLPAAFVGKYSFFLLALFVIATGLSFLETGSNPFVAQLGDPASSESRLTFSQAFNPLGSITGVLIGTLFIFSGVELKPEQVQAMVAAGTYKSYLQHETMRVLAPYLVLGCVVFVWAVLLLRTKFPASAGAATEFGTDGGSFRNLRNFPHLWGAIFAQFLYVGAQVGTWSYFIQYVQDYVAGSEKLAGYLLTGTLIAFAVGRFSATYFMRFVAPNKLMGWYACSNVALLLVGILAPGWMGLWAIFLTSFFMAPMFPTIFALGLKGLGPNVKLGGSLLVMAVIGGAVLTPIMGLISEGTKSMALAMFVPLVCYLFIAYFSFVGSRVRAGLPEEALPQAFGH